MATPRTSIEPTQIDELIMDIIHLRDELGENYIHKDGSFIIERAAKAKRDQLDSVLKRFPFDFRVEGFLEYGDYFELWSLEGGKLYFETKKKKGLLLNKYGLREVCQRPWYEEIRFQKGEKDILYVNHWGQLKVYVKFPQLVELIKDVLGVHS